MIALTSATLELCCIVGEAIVFPFVLRQRRLAGMSELAV
jgi:hypothetical protein